MNEVEAAQAADAAHALQNMAILGNNNVFVHGDNNNVGVPGNQNNGGTQPLQGDPANATIEHMVDDLIVVGKPKEVRLRAITQAIRVSPSSELGLFHLYARHKRRKDQFYRDIRGMIDGIPGATPGAHQIALVNRCTQEECPELVAMLKQKGYRVPRRGVPLTQTTQRIKEATR